MKRRHQGAAPGFLGPREGFWALPGVWLREDTAQLGYARPWRLK